MKTFFKNLEEKNSIFKNTKLLPIIVIAGVIHVIFFIYGFLLINDPKIFREYNFHEYYESNLVYVGAIISLVLFIIWIFLMSKQKSFRLLFQFSVKKIFLQFLCYFFISFFITSFYYSFNLGLISGVKSNYTDQELAKDVEIVNKAAVFLNFDKSYYSLTNRTYDFPFDELTSEEVPSYTTKDYFFDYENRKHRFWSVKEIEEAYDKEKYQSDNHTVRTKINSDNTKINVISYDSIVNVIRNPFDTIPGDYLIFKSLPHLKLETVPAADSKTGEITYKENGSIKKAVVNIKDFPKYLLSNNESYNEYQLNYYNYSNVLIPIKTTVVNNDFDVQEEGYHKVHPKKNYNMNKFVQTLLNSKEKKEQIKKIMADFISLTNKYEIDRNIDTKEWFDLVYNEQSVVRNIIFGTNPSGTDALITYGTGGYTKKTDGKNPYIDVFALTEIFDPINNFTNGNQLNTILSNLYKFFYLAFFLSLIVFTFRISTIKVFITTLIATIIVLTTNAILLDYSKIYFEEVNVQVSCLIILYTCFIILPYVLYKRNKFIFGLIFNLGLFCFIPLAYTILYSISSLQVLSTKTGSEYFPKYVYNDILTNLGGYIHLILPVLGFVFVYFAIALIKKHALLNTTKPA